MFDPSDLVPRQRQPSGEYRAEIPVRHSAALSKPVYNLPPTELKVVLRRVPTNAKAAIAATAINAAINAYSTAVTPRRFSITA